MKRVPLFPLNAQIYTPLGIGIIRSSRASRYAPAETIYEVQLDHETIIRTWSERELVATAQTPTKHQVKPPGECRFAPGESVSTIEGEGVVRNLLRDIAGVPHALVQLIGTTRSIEVPCRDLGPPLEAA
jgi:hypothetical protein